MTEQPRKKHKSEGGASQQDDSWNTANPFEKGTIHDEVELKFDNEMSLFVSKAFLMYSSPVFDRMFKADFIEKSTNTVVLTGKNFDVFNNMLLHMHPGRRKPIPADQAQQMYEIALEYQMPAVEKACEEKLVETVSEIQLCDNWNTSIDKLRKAFEILLFGDVHSKNSIIKSACENISRVSMAEFKAQPLFKRLSDSCKCKLLLSRLTRTDKGTRFPDYRK